jgi:glycine/D-amino acid oxidase-like deaminating enzyme
VGGFATGDTRWGPIVEVTGARNLIIVTGHHRKGILLAPLAAIQVASIIAAG